MTGVDHKFISAIDYLKNRKLMEFLSIYECLNQEDLTLTLPRDVQTVVVKDLNLRN
jgi:hypothetical protein